MALLEVENIHAYYGNIHALKGLTFHVEQGEIVTLIGSNGAGKTTTLRTITSLMHPRDGKITFEGNDITYTPANKLPSQGVAMVPEGRGIFSKLTVEENLELGAYYRNDPDGIRQDMSNSFDLFPRLKERRTQVAGTLSGGEQQMLAIARALMAKPRLLLLDEPSMGLAPVLVDTVFDTIERINTEGMTVLLVEQNALLALEIADRGYVLQTGEIVLADDAATLKKNPEVQKKYLGVD
ncbi:MAG: ABC transporter ATP-binding protein [Anaerolineae bacterium]|nr:ABC transporter ATP-binding protein [Anaerolineae bacterium]